MSKILRAMAWVAPGAAMRRAAALAALDSVRNYEAARGGRRAGSFLARGSSANTEISMALKPLRDRSRDVARNTWIGQRTLDVLVAHVVGTGISVKWETGSDSQDRRLAQAFKAWARKADITGVSNFGALQAIAVRSMLEGGDCAVRMLDRQYGAGGREVPLALKVYEGDYIDEGRDVLPKGKGNEERSRLGVGLGDWDERTGLWMFDEHPGEALSRVSAGTSTSSFVARKDVCHLYRPLRAGQVRGVPVFAPVLMATRDFADLMDALVVKARVEACQALIIEKADGGQTKLTEAVDSGGGPVEKIRPGQSIYLAPGETAKAFNPSQSGGFDQVAIQTLMGVASGAMLTYDQLTGDLRQANYSSLRAGKIEFRRLVEQLQWLVVEPMLLRPVVERWLGLAIIAGVVRERREPYAFDFVMPAVEPIDPKKDLEADIMAVRAGRLSPQEFIAGWGRDWREVVEDHAAFLKVADGLGLVLDIDPRKVSAGGQMQPEPAENSQN